MRKSYERPVLKNAGNLSDVTRGDFTFTGSDGVWWLGRYSGGGGGGS